MRSTKQARAVSRRMLGMAGVMAAAMAPGAAWAAAADADDTGNDIVVTATKREQTLQSVPVAVTVTTAETLQRAQIRDIMDLASVVPSLRVSQHQSSAQTDFMIRGFGNGANNAGIEPSVGVFIDGVYRSRSAAQIGDFPDVQRVEVLRGPQSTLFGKNASAGVISITTDAPQFRWGGSGELSYGNYNAVIAKARITGPLGEHVAFALAAGYNRRDGTTHDGGTGNDTNNRNRYFVRGQLLFTPDDGPRVRIIADYSQIDELCCTVANLLPSATTNAIKAIGGRVNPPGDPYGTVYNNFDSYNKIKDYGFSAQVDQAIGGVHLTSITAYRRNRNVSDQDSDFTSADLLQHYATDLSDITFTQELRATAKVGEKLNLLLGGYYFNEKINQTGNLKYGSQMRPYANALIQGASGGALSVASLESAFGALEGNPTKYTNTFFAQGRGFTEAYRMADESISIFGEADFKLTRRLTVTGGLNYTRDVKHFSTNTSSNDLFSAIDFNAATYAPLRYQLLYGGAVGAGASPANANAYATANMNNAVVNPLASLRALQLMPPFLNVPNAVEPGRTHDGKLSYTARLAWQANDHINLYAGVSTGFKASSVNLSRDSRPALRDAGALAAAGLTTANLRYVNGDGRFAGPENSTVYEAGLKADWGVARVNIAVFRQIIKGFQSNVFTGTGFDLVNAAQESVNGFEFEGEAHPGREWTIAESVTYLRPRYDSFANSAFGDLTGHTPAGIAPLSSTFAVTWDHGLPNGQRLVLRGDWHYEAPTQVADGLPGFITRNAAGAVTSYQTGLNAARAFRREVSELDASVTWVLRSGLQFSAWGRNLSDNRYLTVVFDSPAQQGSVSGYVNQPRTYGVSGLMKF